MQNEGIIIDTELMYKLYGIKPGALVSGELFGNGVIIGLKKIGDKYTLVFHFEDEKYPRYWSKAIKWNDYYEIGITLLDSQIEKYYFSQYLNNEKYSDIVFIVGDKKYYAHKIIIAQNRWFEKMLESNMKESLTNEIKLPVINPTCFEIILKYIYTGKMDIDDRINILELYSTSVELMVDEIRMRCSMLLRDNVDKNNCRDVLKFAEEFCDEKLIKYCQEYMNKYMK